MKYRKKPVVVEVERFFKDKIPHPDGVYATPDTGGKHWIDTLEGRHEVSEGDWIITGVKGEKYPCKPDIFRMTYEFVGEGER